MRQAHTYRGMRRAALKIKGCRSIIIRKNLQGPFPYVAPAATAEYWYALRMIRELGREWRNMFAGAR